MVFVGRYPFSFSLKVYDESNTFDECFNEIPSNKEGTTFPCRTRGVRMQYVSL